MRFADASTVHETLDYAGLVDALQKAHGRAAPTTRAMLVESPAASGDQFLSLVGWGTTAIAVKVVSVFPGNPGRQPPSPSVQGLVCVFDAADGSPKLVVDGAAITVRKTAADSALGARLLSRADAETLLVVGAGAMAPHAAMAHCAVRPSIRRVRIWNRTHERAAALADRLDIAGKPSIEAVRDLETAVKAADIVSCVTMAEKPLVQGAWLRSGTHLDLVGSYLPDMREADDDALKRARIFVDMRRKDMRAGELVDPIRRGVIGWDDIRADLFDLCSGRLPGRQSTSEITLFKNLGGGHLDMFTAEHLLSRLDRARLP